MAVVLKIGRVHFPTEGAAYQRIAVPFGGACKLHQSRDHMQSVQQCRVNYDMSTNGASQCASQWRGSWRQNQDGWENVLPPTKRRVYLWVDVCVYHATAAQGPPHVATERQNRLRIQLQIVLESEVQLNTSTYQLSRRMELSKRLQHLADAMRIAHSIPRLEELSRSAAIL